MGCAERSRQEAAWGYVPHHEFTLFQHSTSRISALDCTSLNETYTSKYQYPAGAPSLRGSLTAVSTDVSGSTVISCTTDPQSEGTTTCPRRCRASSTLSGTENDALVVFQRSAEMKSGSSWW